MTHGAVLVNGLLLAAALLWLAFLVLPAPRAVRARNAFLLRRGIPADFSWTPASVPSGFRLERGPVPDVIVAAVTAADITSSTRDWPRALALVTMLLRHARGDGGIQADLATTYREIVRGTGYCADYVRVYLAAAHTAGLFCRQWGFSFDGFGSHGHAFVEVYDRDRSQWSFLDVFNNVYAVKAGTTTPLDALALRAALVAAPGEIEFRLAGSGRPGYVHVAKLLDYYRAGAREWYLWWGNDIAARERRGVARILSTVSGRLAHRLGSGLLGLPPLVAIVTAENESAIAGMELLRQKILRVGALAAALAVALMVLLVVSKLQSRHG